MKQLCTGLPRRLVPSAALALMACASPKPPPNDRAFNDDSAVLISTDQLSTRPFTVMQHVRGKLGTEDVAFECVVQLAQNKLRIVGMTPYSTRAFVIEQAGVEVHAQQFMLRDVVFEPVQVLYDIHRVFFRGFSGPQTEGTHERLDHGEVVRELWEGGHVVERRFHALDTFSRLLVVEFEGPPTPVIARRVRLTNLHYGYSLEIENVAQQRLDHGYTLDVERKLAP